MFGTTIHYINIGDNAMKTDKNGTNYQDKLIQEQNHHSIYKDINNQNIEQKKKLEAPFNAPFFQELYNDLQDLALIWELSFKLGGLRVNVPKKYDTNHILYEFGESFLSWVIAKYGGSSVVMPSGASNEYNRRQMQAEMLSKKGVSLNDIARQLGVHYSSARRARGRVKNKDKKDNQDNKNQSDLFD